jgi:hypothetical protein
VVVTVGDSGLLVESRASAPGWTGRDASRSTYDSSRIDRVAKIRESIVVKNDIMKK